MKNVIKPTEHLCQTIEGNNEKDSGEKPALPGKQTQSVVGETVSVVGETVASGSVSAK